MNPEVQISLNPVVGRRYALAGVVFLLTAAWIGGTAWVLLWPALSCGLVAWSYLKGGAGIYGKKAGRVSVVSALILFPTRAGQWASWLYYRRKSRLCDEIVPGLYLGRLPTRREAAELLRQGMTRVLDVTAEFTPPSSFRDLTYLNLTVTDLTAPTPRQVQEGVAFIREGLEAGASVYVHCKVGFSRSGALVGAALCALGKAESAEEAIRLLADRRPGIIVRPEAREAIRQACEVESGESF